jgi:hypothetical protein
VSTHPGIELRMSIPAGSILDADSDRLNFLVKPGGAGRASNCPPACLPGCREHGWYEIIPGRDMPFTGAGDLKVEIRPVELPDYVPEMEDE